MNKKYLYVFVLLSIALIGLEFWGFEIREQMPHAYHYLYPVTFLVLFIVQCVFAYVLMKGSRLINGFQPLSILLFVSLDIYLLFSISSINRENEIRNYFARHETELDRIAFDYLNFCNDQELIEMKEAMNLERVFYREDLFQVRLYTCLGYGYGVLYSGSPDIESPEKLGGSPVSKWLKLKDHWYYYSIFD